MGNKRSFEECHGCKGPVLAEIAAEYKGRLLCDICYEEAIELESVEAEKELAEDTE